MNGHLHETEIEDALIGCLADAAGDHLAVCAACQQRVQAARLPIESFKAVSLAWSERRSATMPTGLSMSLLHSVNWQRRLAWGATVTALIAVLMVAPLPLHMGNGRAGQTDSAELGPVRAMGATGVVSGQQTADQQMAQDNLLLNEIDLELNSSSDDSASLGLKPVRDRARTHTATRSMQD